MSQPPAQATPPPPEYYATVRWERHGESFTDHRYSRIHQWEFDGGACIPASPSPHHVPPPWSAAEHLDPEEAYVAALSSCHMLFFLSLAAQRKWLVDGYRDEAVGVMGKNAAGQAAIVRVHLRPQVAFAAAPPSRTQQAEVHHLAHTRCYLANSVNTEILTELP